MSNVEIKTINESSKMQNVSKIIKNKGKKISFVPTMGALHEGHLSLVEEACRKSEVVVVSIFVNPEQFAPGEDYDKYIRDFEGDLEKLSDFNVSYVFYPDVKDIYNDGFQTYVEVTGLQNYLCGKHRQGHFRGVCTIVLKLFNIVKPDYAIFGKKDYQQYKIIERMVNDLNIDTEIIGMPIFREKNGLALSSRNKYLSQAEKDLASNIFRSLNEIRNNFKEGQNSSKILIEKSKKMLNNLGIDDIDYLDIRDPETLEEKEVVSEGDLVAIAAYINKTRLIDNLLL